MRKKRKLFCEYGKTFYKISVAKECMRRNFTDMFSHNKFSSVFEEVGYINIAKGHLSPLMRKLNGVDTALQKNKAVNIELACAKINGIIIFPGETFSFWRLVGNPKKSDGYLPGLVISNGNLGADVGGGLCQLANMIHWLVLHTPLTITEYHHHSDALFPDSGRRVPFGTGTSILYNYVDYRFNNDTDTPVQLKLWVDSENLNGEILSETPFKHRYRIEEEDHHFKKEGDDYFRNSKIYKKVIDTSTKQVVEKKLILTNHAKVMYDPSLIPEEQIRNKVTQ